MATSIDSLQIEISAKASSATQTVDELITKITKLSSSLGKVNGTKINTTIENVNSGSENLSSEITKIGKSASKSSKKFKGLASAIGKFYATYFMAIRGIKKLWSSIESTADYIEAYNYFNVALGKIGADWSHQFEQYGYENAESYAESFSTRLSERLGKLSGLKMEIGADGKGLLTETGMKNLGLNIQEITQYASQLASVTNSVGQTGEVSLAAASSFTKLAGDISSLFNMDYSAVAKNLQSGLIGQSRALYKFGLDITAATLQTYAYNLGIEKSVSEMTQAEKMQLRMIAILDQSKVSWGDLANTINSPSNMIRQFKNNLKETGLVLGQLFIPTLQKVLPLINGASIAFKRLLTDVAGFLNINIDLDSFGQGYTDMEDDVDGITDSYDDASKAAEEWKNQLLGFDEVNKLTENASVDNTGLEDSTIDLTNEILAATSEYEKMWAQAYERMENLGEKWAGFFEGIFEPIRDIFSDIAKGDFEELGKDVSGIVTSLTKWLSDAISSVSWGELGSNVGNFFGGAVSEAFNNLGNVGSLFTNIINGITSFLGSVIDSVKWHELSGNLLDGIKNLFDNINAKSILKGITSFINAITDAIVGVIHGIISNPDKIIGAILALAGFVVEALVNAIVGVVKSSYHLLTSITESIIDSVNQLLGGESIYDEVESFVVEISADVQMNIDSMEATIKEIQTAISDADISYEVSISTDYQAIKDMADAFLGLAGQETLTNEEMSKMEGYRLALIKSDPAFKEILDDTSITYGEMKDAVYEYIASLENQVKMQAALNIATGLQEQLYENKALATEQEKEIEKQKIELENARKAYRKASDALSVYNKKSERMAELQKKSAYLTQAEQEELNILTKDFEENEEYYRSLLDAKTEAEHIMITENVELQSLTSTYNELQGEIDALENEYNYYIEAAGQASTSTEELGGAAKDTSSEIDNVGNSAEKTSGKIDDVGSSAEEASSQIEGVGASATQASNESKTAIDKIEGNITTLTSGNYGVKIKIESDQNSMSKTQSAINLFASDVQKALTLPPLEVVFPTVTVPTISVGSNGTLSTSGGKTPLETFMEFRWAKKNAYAAGGFPEDGLFFANHNELVGQFSNGKTAVANNEQITEGIKRAAYEGMLMALSQSPNNSNVNVVLQGDADGLFKVVQDKANNFTTQTGRPAFLI